MKKFENYIKKTNIIPENRIPYYLNWVLNCYTSLGKQVRDSLKSNEVNNFLHKLGRDHEDWQVRQAKDAINLYLFFRSKETSLKPIKSCGSETEWKNVGNLMVKALRLRHRSPSTEKTYLSWLRRFYKYLKGSSPHKLDSSHVRDYMSYLAVERRIASSTQNQAFNAILFFFRHVLDKDITDLNNTIRAKPRRRLPVVLTKQEVSQIFEHLNGNFLLMCKIIYGGGLRLKECLNLRIKDLEFSANKVIIRSGKGDKDRQTVMPESIKDDLKKHINNFLSCLINLIIIPLAV